MCSLIPICVMSATRGKYNKKGFELTYIATGWLWVAPRLEQFVNILTCVGSESKAGTVLATRARFTVCGYWNFGLVSKRPCWTRLGVYSPGHTEISSRAILQKFTCRIADTHAHANHLPSPWRCVNSPRTSFGWRGNCGDMLQHNNQCKELCSSKFVRLQTA